VSASEDPAKAAAQYGELMWGIRKRFEVIRQLDSADGSDFSAAETAAFNLRKIIEAVAFGCLVACENGVKAIPKDAKGQWNADNIFSRLEKHRLDVLPSPSILRPATADEKREQDVNVTIEGVPERRISSEELRSIYVRTHRWLHERNPYVWKTADIQADVPVLWADVNSLWQFLERHFISIGGAGFFCTLIDSQDGETKVLPLNKAIA
jgi:hypothetical protein